jgi:fibronectin-binding autotransporter adhesin
MGAGDSTNRLFTIGTGTGGAVISNTGTGGLNFTGTGSIAYTGGAGGTAARVLTLTGTNTGGNNILSPIIPANGTSGALSVIKSGTNTWELKGANLYGGGTTINGGTLLANNTTGLATGTAGVSVVTGTLGGNGKVGAIVTSPGGTVWPGQNLGTVAGDIQTLSATSLDMSAGGLFKIALNSDTATAGKLSLSAGLTLDAIGNTSALSVSDLGSSTIGLSTKIQIVTGYTTQSGFFSIGGNIVHDIDTNPGDFFTVGLNNFGIDYNDGNNVSLVVVPEPGTIGSLIGGFGMLLGLRRRRNDRRA